MTTSGANSTTDSRFSPITDNDKAGILWIASLIAGVYSVLSFGVRFYIKRKCYGSDDWSCAAATAVGVGSFIAIYVALSQGLGKSSILIDATHMQLRDIAESVFASRIVLIVALMLSKCSTVLLIKRLFSQDMTAHRVLCDFVLVSIAIWGFGSMIGVSIRCAPQNVLETDIPRCSSQVLRWKLIGIFDVMTELMIVLLSTGLVWRLQMRLKLKLRVILAFVFRLPLIPVAVIHIILVTRMPANDLARAIIPAVTCEQIELGYSLLSATIPNLKSFIMSFDTAMMMDISYKLQSCAQSGTTAGRGSNRMGSSSSRPPRISDFETRDDFIGRLRPGNEGLEYRSEIEHTIRISQPIFDHRDTWTQKSDDRSVTGPEGDSLDRTIRRDVDWRVEETYAEP